MSSTLDIEIQGAQPMTPELAREILYRFLTEEELRVRFATKNRDAMRASIKLGEEPKGHRVEWVTAVSNALVDMLMECGEQFNQLYPYDTVLVGDYLDVLATTRGRFIKAGGGNPE